METGKIEMPAKATIPRKLSIVPSARKMHLTVCRKTLFPCKTVCHIFLVNPTMAVNVNQGCMNCGILVSGIRARGVSSEHMENMEMFSCSPIRCALILIELNQTFIACLFKGSQEQSFFPSNTLIYGISRDGSKNFDIRTCEHMILG